MLRLDYPTQSSQQFHPNPARPALSRSAEPFLHLPFSFVLCIGSPFENGSFTSRNAFENLHPALREFKRINIDQIGRRLAVFCNQNRFSRVVEIGKNAGCLSFKCGYKFCFQNQNDTLVILCRQSFCFCSQRLASLWAGGSPWMFTMNGASDRVNAVVLQILWCPFQRWFLVVDNAVTQIWIDKVLIGNANFLCQRFEIIKNVNTHADGDLLL